MTTTGGPFDSVWIDDFRVNAPCQEDVNGDGTVNVLDLIALLLAFGTSCP